MAAEIRSLEQERAAFAWARVSEVGKDDGYKDLAKGAPALIMSNGLMQTLAFYKSKGKNHHAALLGHICDWLRLKAGAESADFRKVMPYLHGATTDEYMLATEEALEILRWIRQFASAVVND